MSLENFNSLKNVLRISKKFKYCSGEKILSHYLNDDNDDNKPEYLLHCLNKIKNELKYDINVLLNNRSTFDLTYVSNQNSIISKNIDDIINGYDLYYKTNLIVVDNILLLIYKLTDIFGIKYLKKFIIIFSTLHTEKYKNHEENDMIFYVFTYNYLISLDIKAINLENQDCIKIYDGDYDGYVTKVLFHFLHSIKLYISNNELYTIDNINL